MKHIPTVPYDFDFKRLDQKQYIKILLKRQRKKVICLFKKLLFTMENAAAADSSQSNISRLYISKDN